MSQYPYLPFADYFQNGYPADAMGYDNGFKKIYPQPIYMKGVKKIQSFDNFNEMPGPMGLINPFKKIHSVDNFIPEELDMDLNPLYTIRDPCNSRNTYSEVNKAKGMLKKKIAGEADFRIKYKTEVCKYWTSKGYCEFGDQCAFAHGVEEIREKVHLSTNYKTKKCIQYHENLYCPYGIRCQFLHSLANLPKEKVPEETFSYMREIENSEHWTSHSSECICCNRKPRQRLPTFKSITDVDQAKNENDNNNKELHQEDRHRHREFHCDKDSAVSRDSNSTGACSQEAPDADDACLDLISFINQSSSD